MAHSITRPVRGGVQYLQGRLVSDLVMRCRFTRERGRQDNEISEAKPQLSCLSLEHSFRTICLCIVMERSSRKRVISGPRGSLRDAQCSVLKGARLLLRAGADENDCHLDDRRQAVVSISDQICDE